MRKLLTISSLFALLSLSALAADADGKWAAQVSGRNGQTHELTFNFRVDGNTLTGTVVTPRGEVPISEGKISGAEISFSQVMEFGQNHVKLLYKGTIAGDAIRFTRSREGGQGRGMEFTAKKAT